MIINAVKKDDKNAISKCLDHGANPNMILQKEKGNGNLNT
jgi:hypothetical protein